MSDMPDPQTYFLTPCEDRRVRKPDGVPLAPEGERVAISTYWARRIADGDVVPGKSESAKAQKEKAA
jgi:hypothetical protein